jgi:electron transfer flavoprotein beta subunit
MKAVPDLVEEVELTADGAGIDRESMKFVVSEWDAQALEEALLIKDAGGAEVVAVGLAGDPEIDQVLYTALAKGADGAVKIASAGGERCSPTGGPYTMERAAVLAGYLAVQPADLVLTGVQAVDDLDGQLASALAGLLGLPHVSVVVGVEAESGSVAVRQELGGGRSHELVVETPAVIGVQSARQAPRYAPVTRIRQAMQAGGLAERSVEPVGAGGGAAGMDRGLVVRRARLPEATGRAEMMSGSAAEVASQIAGLLRSRGLVKA